MTFTIDTAQELVHKLLKEGITIVGDDQSYEKTIRLVKVENRTLIMTTGNIVSLFEGGKPVFSLEIRDTAHSLADILVRAYHKEEEDALFWVL